MLELGGGRRQNLRKHVHSHMTPLSFNIDSLYVAPPFGLAIGFRLMEVHIHAFQIFEIPHFTSIPCTPEEPKPAASLLRMAATDKYRDSLAF